MMIIQHDIFWAVRGMDGTKCYIQPASRPKLSVKPMLAVALWSRTPLESNMAPILRSLIKNRSGGVGEGTGTWEDVIPGHVNQRTAAPIFIAYEYYHSTRGSIPRRVLNARLVAGGVGWKRNAKTLPRYYQDRFARECGMGRLDRDEGFHSRWLPRHGSSLSEQSQINWRTLFIDRQVATVY